MGRRGGRHGETLEFLDRDAVQAEVHSPLWQAGLYRPPGGTSRRSGEAVPRARPGRARARGRDPRANARSTGLERRAGGVDVRPRSGADRPGRPRRRRDVRLLGLARAGSSQTFVPVYDYVLVSEPLTPDQRVDRLGAAAGHVRREQPVPLLPADRRRPDPVGRLRRDLPLRQTGSGRSSTVGRRRSTSSRRSSSGRSRSSRARVPVPLGRGDRHDLAVHRHVRPGDGRTGDVRARLHRARCRASRWAGGVVRDFILRPDSDLLRLRFVRSPPFPFPPEPFRSLAVRPRSATSSTGRTATRAAAASCSGR